MIELETDLPFVTSTPSGLEIKFWSGPPKRKYEVNGVEVPSVTQVLDVLNKPALVWWGMTVGIEGVLKIQDEYPLSAMMATPKGMIDLLTQEKLTVNHVRDKAGERGLLVHKVLQEWAENKEGLTRVFPEEEQGYIVGLAAFLNDAHIEPLDSEVMVGSPCFGGYAGRYDLRAEITKSSRVVTKVFPKKPPLYTVVPKGRGIIDLKTSKGIYESHMLQLAGYESASRDSGYEPTDWQAVLHVTADGKYEFVPSPAQDFHFTNVLLVYNELKQIKEAMKRK